MKGSSHTLSVTLAVIGAMGVLSGTVQASPENQEKSWSLTEKTQHAARRLSRLREIMNLHRRHAKRLLGTSNVIASGTSLQPDGEPCLKVFTTRPDTRGVPDFLDGVRVMKEVSTRFYAQRGQSCDATADQFCEPTERWSLPVPIGISVGHPGMSAGTVGARVTDGLNVLLLSNNHVLADGNQARLGDPILQPGRIDGGINPDDAVAALTDFEPIDFCRQVESLFICNDNTIDAAIALSTPSELGVATPTDGLGLKVGYGTPLSSLHPAYGVPDRLGDEDLTQLLGISVQKFGRTTGQTSGLVDTINADVNVCYDPDCANVARFTDQLIIRPGAFSAEGDSGSLVVDNLRRPVGLLFAGGDEFTVINRIDLVLNRFGVEIDDGIDKRIFAGHTADAVTDKWYRVAMPAATADTAVVMVSLQTFSGTDTAGLRLRRLSADEFEVRIEEEQSRDSETAHIAEAVGYLALEAGPIYDTAGLLIGETGTINGGQSAAGQWHTVTLQGIYPAPVVLMNMTTTNGTQPAHVRVRNVTGNSFEYQIEEWDYLDQSHISEEIGFVVLESGFHTLADGTQIEAGTVQTDHSWANVFFSASYRTRPVTLSQSQTTHGEQAVVTRHRNITRTGFEVRLQEEEANDNWHFVETIAYVAVTP